MGFAERRIPVAFSPTASLIAGLMRDLCRTLVPRCGGQVEENRAEYYTSANGRRYRKL